MRYGLILAAALAVTAAAAMATTSARADDEWCGYATGDKALIECGYSSVAQCENAVGKGGVCFVDPEYALNDDWRTFGNISKLGPNVLNPRVEHLADLKAREAR
jgi:hypothetical protein